MTLLVVKRMIVLRRHGSLVIFELSYQAQQHRAILLLDVIDRAPYGLLVYNIYKTSTMGVCKARVVHTRTCLNSPEVVF